MIIKSLEDFEQIVSQESYPFIKGMTLIVSPLKESKRMLLDAYKLKGQPILGGWQRHEFGDKQHSVPRHLRNSPRCTENNERNSARLYPVIFDKVPICWSEEDFKKLLEIDCFERIEFLVEDLKSIKNHQFLKIGEAEKYGINKKIKKSAVVYFYRFEDARKLISLGSIQVYGESLTTRRHWSSKTSYCRETCLSGSHSPNDFKNSLKANHKHVVPEMSDFGKLAEASMVSTKMGPIINDDGYNRAPQLLQHKGFIRPLKKRNQECQKVLGNGLKRRRSHFTRKSGFQRYLQLTKNKKLLRVSKLLQHTPENVILNKQLEFFGEKRG
jgi:hypothetical protein